MSPTSNRRRVHAAIMLLGIANVSDIVAMTGLQPTAIKDAIHALKATESCITVRRGGGAASSTYMAIETPFSATKNMQPVLSVLHRIEGPVTTHEIAKGARLTTRHCRRPLELLKASGLITGKPMRRTTEWARVPGLELPPLSHPMVSGKQAGKFLRSFQMATPEWVPQRDMVNFLSSMFMTPGHRA